MEYEHNILGPDGKIITRNLSRLPKKIFRVFSRGVMVRLRYLVDKVLESTLIRARIAGFEANRELLTRLTSWELSLLGVFVS